METLVVKRAPNTTIIVIVFFITVYLLLTACFLPIALTNRGEVIRTYRVISIRHIVFRRYVFQWVIRRSDLDAGAYCQIFFSKCSEYSFFPTRCTKRACLPRAPRAGPARSASSQGVLSAFHHDPSKPQRLRSARAVLETWFNGAVTRTLFCADRSGAGPASLPGASP